MSWEKLSKASQSLLSSLYGLSSDSSAPINAYIRSRNSDPQSSFGDFIGISSIVDNLQDYISVLTLPTSLKKHEHKTAIPIPGLSKFQKENDIVQLFFFPYQCQSCRGEPLILVVRREGIKLQLVGRSQFEKIKVPRHIPKEENKYYSDAKIAYNTGRILAGLFYLRTMIEQYMRRVLDNYTRVTGEELAEQYAKLLDEEFPKRFKTLRKIYEELSAKIHDAQNDEGQFLQSLFDINTHFEQLKLIPLAKSIKKKKQ